MHPHFHMICRLALILACAGAAAGADEPARVGITYYVSPTGDDATPGTSPAQAWATLARVSRQRLLPGDHVLLQGGATFAGPLLLTAEDAGSAAAPVEVASFGTGRATIDAGLGFGVLVSDAGGIEVRDLICRGTDRVRSHGSGVAIVNTLPGDARLAHVRIDHVEASGFGRALAAPGTRPEGQQSPQGCGIMVGGDARDGSQSGFDDIAITACDLHDNAYYGMLITGAWDAHATGYANTGLRIAGCRAHDNPGDPLYHENHSGSGILVEDCSGGLVEGCTAWNNGAQCPAAPGGPCGIWAASCHRVTIQDCEAYANHTGNGLDGDGFDLDGGCTECVLQYDFSHDNDGAGFLIYTYRGAPHTDRGNVVRWNLSCDDARTLPSYGAIFVGNDGAGMDGVEIYQNTCIGSGAGVALINVRGAGIGAAFRNNLLIAAAAPLVRMERDLPTVSFTGNLYWNHNAALARSGDHDVADLAAWRALGKEMQAGRPCGAFADPHLDLAAARGDVADVPRCANVHGLVPPAGSPAGTAAIDLRALLGGDLGGRDLAGRRLTAIVTAGAFISTP